MHVYGNKCTYPCPRCFVLRTHNEVSQLRTKMNGSNLAQTWLKQTCDMTDALMASLTLRSVSLNGRYT